MLARTVATGWLDWDWRTHYHDGMLTRPLVGGLCFSPCGPVHRAVPTTWRAASAQSGTPVGEQGGSSNTFYDRFGRCSRTLPPYSTYRKQIIKSKTIQGEGIKLHFLKEGVSKASWTDLKTTWARATPDIRPFLLLLVFWVQSTPIPPSLLAQLEHCHSVPQSLSQPTVLCPLFPRAWWVPLQPSWPLQAQSQGYTGSLQVFVLTPSIR